MHDMIIYFLSPSLCDYRGDSTRSINIGPKSGRDQHGPQLLRDISKAVACTLASYHFKMHKPTVKNGTPTHTAKFCTQVRVPLSIAE
jgi:hypothetical protein